MLSSGKLDIIEGAMHEEKEKVVIEEMSRVLFFSFVQRYFG